MPTQEEFAQRREFIGSLDALSAIRIAGGFMAKPRPDNPYFPHNLYGIDPRTGASETYLFTHGIPEIIGLYQVPPLRRVTREELARIPLVGELNGDGVPNQNYFDRQKIIILEAFHDALRAIEKHRSDS